MANVGRTLSVCDTSRPVLPGAVSRISSRTGWNVDRIEFHLRVGGMFTYGRSDGGAAQPDEHLHVTEHICAVEQMNHQVGHLGSCLIFHLSSGRAIRVSGSRGLKKQKNHTKLTVSAGEQIHALEFAGSQLIGIWKAPTVEAAVLDC